METREELTAMRAELVERLAREAYWITPHDDEKLAKVATLKIALDAVDYILANDIEPPPAAEPSMMIV